jgi:hypothetical protein
MRKMEEMMRRSREEGRSEGDALIAIIGRTLQNIKPHFWLKIKELHCKKGYRYSRPQPGGH